MTGIVALGLLALSAPGSVQPAPDAHVIRRERGDIIDFSDARRIYPGDPRAAYVAPVAGWRYRLLGAGERLAPLFYGPAYVIADPARFGLRARGGKRRWIRYGDDLLLVNIGSGRVLQVRAGRYR